MPAPSLGTCATAALAALAALIAAAPARAELAAGLAPPPAGPNVTDLVTDGLDASGTIIDEDVVPASTDFDEANTRLETAADNFDESIGDGTSATVHACASGAAAAAAVACAAVLLL